MLEKEIPLIKAKDIIPYLSQKIKLDDFKDEICETLEEYYVEKQQNKFEGFIKQNEIQKNYCCKLVIITFCTLQNQNVKIALENCSKRVILFLSVHMVFLGNAFFNILKAYRSMLYLDNNQMILKTCKYKQTKVSLINRFLDSLLLRIKLLQTIKETLELSYESNINQNLMIFYIRVVVRIIMSLLRRLGLFENFFKLNILMKLFMAFCQGKSILLKDKQKLTKYIDLCLKTPVNYKGIQQSIGYHQIMVAQFNSKEFNKGLFPQFINLIGRDFKELDPYEFNYFIQALSCYVESAINQNVYDKKIFESVIDSISLNATYDQKCLFFITIFWYIGFYRVIPLSRQSVDKFQAELFEQVPQTAEERLWRVFLELHLLQGRRNLEGQSEAIQMEERKIMNKFINQIEEIDINLPKLKNIMSRFMLLKYYPVLKYFYAQSYDNRVHKLLFSIYQNCHNYIQKNLSSLNSFGFHIYIDLFSKTKDMFQSAKWDLLLNEINSRNLNEMPTFDIIALTFVIIKNEKMTPQLGNRIIQYLYENMDSINSYNYAEVFQILHEVDSNIKDQFVTKLQLKVVPKDLPLNHISLILFVLKRLHRIDQNILEKYLAGIGTRIKEIDNQIGFEILSAINSVGQQNPLIFAQIQKLKLNEEKDQSLLIEILKYLQLHDPSNGTSTKIQEGIVRLLDKEFNLKLICSILEILMKINRTTKKSITLIPELKKYIKRGIDEIKSLKLYNDNDYDEVILILRIQYHIDI
ncbi:unnamed protein product [Paramecium octaurelia]|uniref:Uncharacterized protein n=1 Tax=Paramecium octaurelia TaxID=43137 RepID=A0A8S1UAZ1_PAROT|nr:unnamed protein product [Paramecium octaurelia]